MKINKCPKCGSKFGYYVKHQTGGSMRRLHNFEGNEIEEVIVTNKSIQSGSIGYCIICHKKIIDDVYKGVI